MSTLTRKISPSLSLVDETADVKQNKQAVLHVLAGAGSLALALLDSNQNKFVALESYNLQNTFTADALALALDQVLSTHPFLKKDYAAVRFAYDSHRSTLVPEALYDPAALDSYIRFNHSLEKDETVYSDQLRNMDTRNIFILPNVLQKTMQALYPQVKFQHSSSALLEGLARQYKNETKPKLVIHVSLTHFEIVLFEGKHLKFYNTFRHQTSEDFIYYLLFVCEQLKLNPETLDLILIGEIERNSAIYAILQKYVRNIRFGERPEVFAYAHPLNTIPKHFYANLFSQQLFG
jgi:hypothetical protein